MPNDLHNIDWTYHAEYLEISNTGYNEIKKLKKEHDRIQAKLSNNMAEDEEDRLVHLMAIKNDAIGRHAMVVVVFCSMALEAFINYYGIINLSKSYFMNYLDKMDIKAKWLIIPRLITGNQLDTGLSAMEDFSWLIKIRNKLVHYKSKEIPVKEITESDFLWESDAMRALQTVKGLLIALKNLDKNIDVTWIEQ